MEETSGLPGRFDRRSVLRSLGVSMAGADICLGAGVTTADAAQASDAMTIGRRVADEFLSRQDIMMYAVKDVNAVHYAEAAAAYGSARLGGIGGDKTLVEGVVARYRRILRDNIPNTANHVDANVFGIWPLELFQRTGEAAYRDDGLRLADSQWEQTGPEGLTLQTRYWIDDVWMIGSLQTQAYRTTRNPVYIDRAGREAAAYIDRLQQGNGLFYHGPKAPFFWGRGNGWVAAGLAEVLSELPETHASYPVVLAGYRHMMQALLTHQSPDGMWRQLIDHPEAWLESSATAMFGFAFTMGVKQGILSSPYATAAQNAWDALLIRLGSDGRLSGVCVGTGQSEDGRYYLGRATVTGDLHGQAPLLWFASARLKV